MTDGGLDWTLTWSVENRLVEARENSNTLSPVVKTYTYDADGSLMMTNKDGTLIILLGQLYQDNVTAGTSNKNYWLGGRLIGRRWHTSNPQFYLTDHLGSATTLLNSSGGKSADMRYDPWGEERWVETALPHRFRFTGQRMDETLNLYDYNARYYDPSTGRFISADTLIPQPFNPQAFNRYAYTLNNPVRYTDPSGRCIPEEADGSGGDCEGVGTPPPPGSAGNPIPSNPDDPTAQDYRDMTRLSINWARNYSYNHWKLELTPEELLAFLLSQEVGDLIDNPLVEEAITRRWNEYCSGGGWSASCVNNFWAYYSPMHNLYASSTLQSAFTDVTTWVGYVDDAYRVAHTPGLGGWQADRPWGWATFTNLANPQTFDRFKDGGLTQGGGSDQAYSASQYIENGVYKLFLVLSPDQQATLCGGNNCTGMP
ncbi:MAG: RHS repeat-associated core domain-containing protein [Chloroflexota bacterium]